MSCSDLNHHLQLLQTILLSPLSLELSLSPCLHFFAHLKLFCLSLSHKHYRTHSLTLIHTHTRISIFLSRTHYFLFALFLSHTHTLTHSLTFKVCFSFFFKASLENLEKNLQLICII